MGWAEGRAGPRAGVVLELRQGWGRAGLRPGGEGRVEAGAQLAECLSGTHEAR